MKKTVREIAHILNGEVVGDASLVIIGLSGIKEAQPGEITFLANPKYASLMHTTKASCVITSKETSSDGRLTLIRTDDPNLAFAKMVSVAGPEKPQLTRGISPLASVSKHATIGDNVAIEPFAVIEDGAEIGDGTTVYAGVYIGHEAKIGRNVLLYPHVSVRERCIIGNSVIVHSGAVIGSDGFGFTAVEELHHKIPQIGTVVIEDDVEIGANVTIDRARFGKTVIGKGTKIDNLVQIAHNVVIGENSIIVAQAGISGSTTLGKNVIIAGQAGIVGHVEVGDNTIVAAQSGVQKSLDKNQFVIGSPARPHITWKRIKAAEQRLPGLFKLINELSDRIKALEEKVHGATENDKK
jgi:UDP-3-O-[3-hydroxymyristoyl] glucosamine N-acyltransferase